MNAGGIVSFAVGITAAAKSADAAADSDSAIVSSKNSTWCEQLYNQGHGQDTTRPPFRPFAKRTGSSEGS